MKLSEAERTIFFENFLPLLHYAAVYSGIIPEGTSFRDFYKASAEITARSRDAIFMDKDLLNDYASDNAKFLESKLASFVPELKKAVFSDFIVLKQGRQSATFMDRKTQLFYHVTGISDSVEASLKHVPGYCKTALFNFGGRIIWDGLVIQKDRPVNKTVSETLLQKYASALLAKNVIELL